MDELISRQAAIDAFYKYPNIDWTTLDVLAKINALPSAQSERKTGRWISTDDRWDGEYFVCSECGCPWTLIEGSPEENGMNFCPSCGADMREREDNYDYERAVEQLEHDILYEPTFNPNDGSM